MWSRDGVHPDRADMGFFGLAMKIKGQIAVELRCLVESDWLSKLGVRTTDTKPSMSRFNLA